MPRPSAPLSGRDPAGAGSTDVATPRQQAILDVVRRTGFATIDALAREFGVSAQTVRRDIILLDEQRLLQRFHGGAGLRQATVRLGYAEKQGAFADAKERIGRAAAARIADGASVFLDVGTTVEAVARALGGRGGLRVFTTSLASAALLAGRPGIDLFVAGGSVRGADGSLVGETTTSLLRSFRFSHAVIGFSGVDSDGALMDFDLDKVAVKQAAIARADTVIAVGDASKLGRPALVRVAEPGAVKTLVTDAAPPGPAGAALEGAGVMVAVAA